MAHALFKKLNAKEVRETLAQIGDAAEISQFLPDRTVVMAQNLAFYPGYRMLDISDMTEVPERRIFVVAAEKGGHIVLNYSNEPIYGLNESAPIRLDSGVVYDYVRFFFQYVRGPHGRFILAESLDDIKWQEEPPLNARKAISKMLTPLTLIERKPDGYILESSFVFRDSLIKAKLDVDKDGIIRMFDEEIVIEDMPVMDDDLNL